METDVTTTLKDHQFELLPGAEANSGYLFGLGARVEVNEDGFHPGDDDWGTSDWDNPTGGIAFGRDILKGPVWGWDLFVNEDWLSDALDTMSAIRSAWRCPDIRDTPGGITSIRYRVNGRDRRIFGRPRRFSAPPSNMILSGYVPITTDFQAVDGYTYDDLDTKVVMHVDAASSEGGMRFPVIFPATTAAPSAAAGQAVVGGDARAYPKVTFTGPIANPYLVTDSWTLKLDVNLSAGETAVVDLRPWVRTARKNGVAKPSMLSRRANLSKMYFDPSSRPQMTFGGTGTSGATTCAVQWRNAWNSI